MIGKRGIFLPIFLLVKKLVTYHRDPRREFAVITFNILSNMKYRYIALLVDIAAERFIE